MSKPNQAKRPAEPAPPRSARVGHMLQLANLLVGVRQTFGARQEEVARRAGVSRQWLVDFEQAKPTCEIALVLRLIQTLGLELDLKPYEPVPNWLIRAKIDVAARKMETQRKRNIRRQNKRDLMREVRMARNTKAGVMTDLE